VLRDRSMVARSTDACTNDRDPSIAQHDRSIAQIRCSRMTYAQRIPVTWLVVTKVWSESFRLVTERRHDISVLCAVTHIFAYCTSQVSVMHVIFFIVECGIARFLCAMCVFACTRSSGIILVR